MHIVNGSLNSGCFPAMLKTEMTKSLLKKRDLDSSAFNSYRPISNVPFINKIEKVTYNLDTNDFFDDCQSGFLQHHRTEHALVKRLYDVHLNTKAGKITVLVLIDLRAAFDTIHSFNSHPILSANTFPKTFSKVSQTSLN